MINSHPKTDRAKLAGLEIFLHKKFIGCKVTLEPYLKFTKGEDEYIGFDSTLTREEVKKYKIHHPDALLFWKQMMIILELDGAIHDIKVNDTDERNIRYKLNDLVCVVVNESDLKFKLDIAKSALLPQDTINQEFLRKIKIRISQVK